MTLCDTPSLPQWPSLLIRSTIRSTIRLLGLLASLSLLALPLSGQRDFDPQRPLSVAELRADFEILQRAFEDEHPAWGFYYPSDTMRAWFANTAEQLQEPLTELEFRRLLYALNARLGCGHTRISTPKAYRKYYRKKRKAKYPYQRLPFQAHKIDGRLIVLHAYTADSTRLVPGTEILSINGRKATRVMREIETMFPSDGYNLSHKERVINLNFTSHFFRYYGESAEYDLDIRTPDGEQQQFTAAAYASNSEEYRDILKAKKIPSARKDSTIFRKKGGYQLYLLREDLQTAVLRIKSFAGRRGIRFYRKVFRYLSDNQIPRLVIDLRDNGGGSGRESMTLISYINDETVELYGKKKRGKPRVDRHLNSKFGRKVLAPLFLPLSFKSYRDSTHQYMGIVKKPQRSHNFNGQVFILYNGLSFSSSAIAGAYLVDGGEVTIIGQESGGGQVRTNAFQTPSLTLPHSGIRFKYPFYAITSDVKAEDRGRGLLPDYPIEYQLEDLLSGRDLELEKVLELTQPE